MNEVAKDDDRELSQAEKDARTEKLLAETAAEQARLKAAKALADGKVVPIESVKRPKIVETSRAAREAYHTEKKAREGAETKEEPKTNGAEAPKAEKPKAAGVKFAIELGGAHSPKISQVVTQVMGSLKDSGGAQIYQRAGSLMRPLSEPDLDMNGLPMQIGDLVDFTESSLFHELNEHLRFYHWKAAKKNATNKQPEQVEVNSSFGIGQHLPKQILAARGRWPFPRVTGILNAPTLNRDGTLLDKEGYDPKTGLLLLNIPKLKINPRPSRTEGLEAVALLKEQLFPRTPFLDGAARSVALALPITALVRPGALPYSPLFLFSSSTSGAGKTFIVEATYIIMTGEAFAPMGECEDRDEMNKHLAAQILAGRSLISLDNVNFGELKSGLLNKVITQMKIALRYLGKGIDGRVQIRAVTTATGINLTIADDLDRRALLCRLVPKEEWTGDRDWGDRNEEKEALQVVAQHRLEYLKACLTIPLSYRAAGYPNPLPPLNGFKHWSRMVCSALTWLDEPNPCDTMEAARGGDTGRQSRSTVYMSLFDVFKGKSCTAANIVEATKSEYERSETFKELMGASPIPTEQQRNLRDALMAATKTKARELSSHEVGTWLEGSKDIPAGRLVLRKAGKTRLGQVLWQVDLHNKG